MTFAVLGGRRAQNDSQVFHELNERRSEVACEVAYILVFVRIAIHLVHEILPPGSSKLLTYAEC